MDIPEWTCETCRYSGPCFECGGQEKVECRRNHPNNEGFPIMPISSWCWDGTPAYNQRRGKDESNPDRRYQEVKYGIKNWESPKTRLLRRKTCLSGVRNIHTSTGDV